LPVPDGDGGDTLTATVLGCGSSTGVPRIGNDWGACDPADPRNRRRRCALLIERRRAGGVTRVLIDTGADLREQLIDAAATTIDGVLYTHDHADHIHGIDDLRVAAINRRRRVPVYADVRTGRELVRRFGYCFETPSGSGYPPILDMHEVAPGDTVTIDGEGGPIEAVPFAQRHGDIDALGYRVAGLAYSSDLNDLPDASLEQLAGLDVWIVDALRWRPHPTHFSVSDALTWIARLRPASAFLTNMHMDLDYRTLAGILPPGVAPAHDGLRVTLIERSKRRPLRPGSSRGPRPSH
jgi:phosphoribosyl 1,2-cyclic phosphate phosphodiesterase